MGLFDKFKKKNDKKVENNIDTIIKNSNRSAFRDVFVEKITGLDEMTEKERIDELRKKEEEILEQENVNRAYGAYMNSSEYKKTMSKYNELINQAIVIINKWESVIPLVDSYNYQELIDMYRLTGDSLKETMKSMEQFARFVQMYGSKKDLTIEEQVDKDFLNTIIPYVVKEADVLNIVLKKVSEKLNTYSNDTNINSTHTLKKTGGNI